MLARRGRDGNGKVVFVVGVIQATTVLVVGLVPHQCRVVAAEACGVARRAMHVVSVVCFRTLCCRLLLVGQVLRTLGPTVLRRTAQVAVHFAWGGLALAVFLAASQGFLFSRLIVARAIPIASRAFATVAFQRSVGRAAVIAITIVMDTTTMAPISLLVNISASIVTKSYLASGALAAPTVGGLANTPAELLQSFTKETLVDAIRLLALDHIVELLLLKESLKDGCDGLDGLVVEHFSTQDKLLLVVFFVQHVIPLKSELVQRFWDVARQKKLGKAEHLFETVRMHARRGK